MLRHSDAALFPFTFPFNKMLFFAQTITENITEDETVSKKYITLRVRSSVLGIISVCLLIVAGYLLYSWHAQSKISPYGFGPYPEAPEDIRFVPVWQQEHYKKLGHNQKRSLEIIDRVLIKLWEQGERGFEEGFYDCGNVYPFYDNTIYVRWHEEIRPDGTEHRYVSHLHYPRRMAFTSEQRAQITQGNFPPGIQALLIDDSGIPAIHFLNSEQPKEFLEKLRKASPEVR